MSEVSDDQIQACNLCRSLREHGATWKDSSCHSTYEEVLRQTQCPNPITKHYQLVCHGDLQENSGNRIGKSRATVEAAGWVHNRDTCKRLRPQSISKTDITTANSMVNHIYYYLCAKHKIPKMSSFIRVRSIPTCPSTS